MPAEQEHRQDSLLPPLLHEMRETGRAVCFSELTEQQLAPATTWNKSQCTEMHLPPETKQVDALGFKPKAFRMRS